jgi:hypothetical protein
MFYPPGAGKLTYLSLYHRINGKWEIKKDIPGSVLFPYG